MWRTAAFISMVLSILSVYAQECVPAKPANFEELSEFHEDGNCCYQDPLKRKCGDLEFCFGVMISHGSSLHNSCCDLYPSCGATKTLLVSLSKLRSLSLVDLSISAIICILSIPHAIIQVKDTRGLNANTKLVKLTTLILLLEIVDMGISSRIIQIARQQDSDGKTAADTADALIGADCFKDPHDSPKIMNIHSELEKFETIQIVELAFECCLVIMHFAKVIFCLRNQVGNTAETVDTVSAYILDANELFLAGIAYVVLVNGINDFHGLYNDMKYQTASNVCIHTCCFIPPLKAGPTPKVSLIEGPTALPTTPNPSFRVRPKAIPSTNPVLEPSLKSFDTRSPSRPSLRPTRRATNPHIELAGNPSDDPPDSPSMEPNTPRPTLLSKPSQNLLPENYPISTTRYPVSTTSESRLDEVKTFLLENSVSDPANLEQLGSSQNAAMVWIADKDKRHVPVTDNYFVQRYSLAVLYFATGGTRWDLSQGWLDEGIECDWYGVNDPPGQLFDTKGCNHSIEVRSIALERNNLRGIIPPEVGTLSKLIYLDLSSNCLWGQMPPDIGKLEELKILRLEANALKGTLPAEFLAMTSLTEVYLYYNDFIGEVPQDSTLCKRKIDMYTTLDCEQCPEWVTIMNGGPCCDTCWYWWADNSTLISDDTGCERL